MARPSPAVRAWAILTGGVLAWEFLAPAEQLLSDEAHRFVARNPVAGRVAIISAGALLTAHLAALLDPRYDVISRSFWLWNLDK